MSPIRCGFALLLAALTLTLGTGAGRADQPDKDLPRLPPPPKAKAPAAPANVNRMPVEFTIAIADLEKQTLRSLVQKIDPKAEPKLPIVVKGNEQNFALGAADDKMPAQKPAFDAPREFRQNLKEMRAARPRFLEARRLGAPGVLRGGLLARPVAEVFGAAVATVGGQMLGAVIGKLGDEGLGGLFGKVDLTYRIELRSFAMSVTGNTMTCEVGGGFHAEGKAAQAGPAPAVPPNVRDISVKMTVTKELQWSDNGKLELKGGSSKVWIDPDAPIVGFPRLDIERVLRLNGLLGLVGGILDKELMKRLPTDTLPDLATVAPKLNEKVPFLALAEITAYPIRSDEKNVIVSLVVGLVPANQKPEGDVKITVKPGPAPEPKLRGRIVFDKDGKPEVKLDGIP